METRIIVAGIVTKKEEILLGKKAKGQPPYPDVWHTIGGGVEDSQKAINLLASGKYDDTYFHEKLQRELKEEANISVNNIHNLCPRYRSKPREAKTENKNGILTHYIFLEYFCDFVSGPVKAGDDIAELQWVNKKNLNKVQLTPPSQQMYKEIHWI